MLMFRGSTNDWLSHTEYSAKRFLKMDLDKLRPSPRPLFILPIP